MAVDTAEKRFSMVSFAGETFGLRVPDATDMDDDEDRLNELFLYYGLAVESTPSPGSPSDAFYRVLRRRVRR